MIRTMKRIVALLLVAVMAFSAVGMLPGNSGGTDDEAVAAQLAKPARADLADPDGSPASVAPSYDGKLRVKKTVEKVAGSESDFDITLEVVAETEEIEQSIANPLAVCIVMDRSFSMTYSFDGQMNSSNDRMNAARVAAQKFVESLDKNCYVSIATFCRTGEQRCDWTQLSDAGRSQVVNCITNEIPTPTFNDTNTLGTNIQAGMRTAKDYMASDKISSIPEKNKLVVLISDGQPNYYYNANGNLKNPSGGEASTKEVCDSAVAAANELPGEKYAVYIGKLSDSCYGSYSVSDLLNDITANTGDPQRVFDAQNTEKLSEDLNKIASQAEKLQTGDDGTGWYVTDDLHELFDFKEVIKGGKDKDTVSYDNADTVKWHITEKDLVSAETVGNKTTYTYNATYRITLKTSDPEFRDYDEADEEGTTYPTSDETVLLAPVEDGKHPEAARFNEPTVKGEAPWYYYDIDVKIQTGEDGSGEKTYDEEPRYIFDEGSEYRDKARVNTKVVDSSYVPGEGEEPGRDYIMLPDAYAGASDKVEGKVTPKGSGETQRYSVAETPGADAGDHIIGYITEDKHYEYVYDLNAASVTVEHYYVDYGYTTDDETKYLSYDEAKAASSADPTRTETLSGYIGDTKTINKKDKDGYTFVSGENGDISLSSENDGKVYRLYYKAEKPTETVYYVINEHFGTRRKVIGENGDEITLPAEYVSVPGQTNTIKSGKGVTVPQTPVSEGYSDANPAYERVNVKLDGGPAELGAENRVFPSSTDENAPTAIDIYYENEVDERGEPITIVVKHQYIEMNYEIDEDGRRSAEPKASDPVPGDTDTFTGYKGQYIAIAEKPNGYTPDSGNEAKLKAFVDGENAPDYAHHKLSGSEPAETTLSYYKLLPGAATVTVTHKYIPYITVTSYEKDDEGNIISWKTEELPDEENITEYTVYYGKECEAADGSSYVPGPYYEGERVSVEMRPEGFTPRGDVPGKIADVRAHGQTIELVYEKHDNDRRDEADYEVYHRFYYSEKYVDETGALKTREVYERGNDAPIDSGKEKIGAELPVAKPEYAGYAVKPGTPDKKTIEPGLNVVYVDYVRETDRTALSPEVSYKYYERQAEIVDGELVWGDYKPVGEPVTQTLPETYAGQQIDIPLGNADGAHAAYKDFINGEKHVYTQTVTEDNYKFVYEYGRSDDSNIEKLPVTVKHYSGKAYVENGVNHEPEYYKDFALIEGEGKSSSEYKNIRYTAESLTGRVLDRVEVLKGEGEDRTKKQYAPEELSGGKLNEIIDEATEINFYYIESSRVPASYEVYTKTRKYNITVNGPVLVSDPELAKDKEYKGYKEEIHDLSEYFKDKTVESFEFVGGGSFSAEDGKLRLGDGVNVLNVVYREETDVREPGKVEIHHIYNEYDETTGETRTIDTKTSYPPADEEIWVDSEYSYTVPEEDKAGYDKVEVDRPGIIVDRDSGKNVITVVYTKKVNPKPAYVPVPAYPYYPGFVPGVPSAPAELKLPDAPVPLGDAPDEEPKREEAGGEAILDEVAEEVPLAEAPDELSLDDGEVPLADATAEAEEEELGEDEVPLGDAPATGDSSHVMVYAILMLAAALGLAAIALTSRKKKENR